jgi:ABC-2 type transport system permease protein
MNSISDMLWIELRKAIRSRMPLFTALGSLLLPLGTAFLLFVSRNPEIARQLGLISTKANLLASTATNWPTYLGMVGQILAMGGMLLFVLIISWVFGREFVDGTLKDLLAVPVDRAHILLAKFIVTAIWSAGLAVLMFGLSLIMGTLIQLPQGSTTIFLQACSRAAVTVCLVIAAMLPFAFFASLGRGYLLPVGVVFLTLILANLVVVVGWGEYFPWAVLGLYAQGKDSLPPVSFVIVVLTGLVGMVGTYVWWKYADQTR